MVVVRIDKVRQLHHIHLMRLAMLGLAGIVLLLGYKT